MDPALPLVTKKLSQVPDDVLIMEHIRGGECHLCFLKLNFHCQGPDATPPQQRPLYLAAHSAFAHNLQDETQVLGVATPCGEMSFLDLQGRSGIF